MTDLRSYGLVTASYWGFTVTDGALRMLVLLHFYKLGYTPLEIAFLFLFYEIFGIVTNLVGGWVGSRLGLKVTLFAGLALQVFALTMLAGLSSDWTRGFAVAYVMAAQALSGIAKDLTKMSSKSAIKLIVPTAAQSALFRWVAFLTGSKNALKGGGFFLGAALLSKLGFASALVSMAVSLAAVLLVAVLFLSGDMGRSRSKVKFTNIFSKTSEINILSAARFFLFGSRDVWFVVAVPVFFSETLGWSFTQVGGFMAAWVIGYGAVQSLAPMLSRHKAGAPTGRTAQSSAFLLAAVPALIALALDNAIDPGPVLVGGLLVFGAVFAVNSAVHSYLILKYSDHDKVALNVGFYYMANAGGRLTGTVLSGWVFQVWGLSGCLWVSAVLVVLAGVLSMRLPD